MLDELLAFLIACFSDICKMLILPLHWRGVDVVYVTVFVKRRKHN